jgi:hypothetical protein
MGPIRCPETSVNNYQTTLRSIPEERRSETRKCSFVSEKIFPVIEGQACYNRLHWLLVLYSSVSHVQISCLNTETTGLNILNHDICLLSQLNKLSYFFRSKCNCLIEEFYPAGQLYHFLTMKTRKTFWLTQYPVHLISQVPSPKVSRRQLGKLN